MKTKVRSSRAVSPKLKKSAKDSRNIRDFCLEERFARSEYDISDERFKKDPRLRKAYKKFFYRSWKKFQL